MAKDIKTYELEDGGLFFAPNEEQTEYAMGGPINASWPKPTATDSLNLYNNAVKVLDYYKKNNNYEQLYDPMYNEKNIFTDLEIRRETFNQKNKNKTIKYPTKNGKSTIGSIPFSTYYEKLSPYQFKQRESANTVLDTRSPMSLYDLRINPAFSNSFRNENVKDSMHDDGVNINGYDPIAVKPYKLLTPAEKKLREQRYGKPVSNITKKPKSIINKVVEEIPGPKVFTNIPTPINPNYKPRTTGIPFLAPEEVINTTTPMIEPTPVSTNTSRPGLQTIGHQLIGDNKLVVKGPGVKNGSQYMTFEEYEKFAKDNADKYNFSSQPNSVGYVYKPGVGITKYANGGYKYTPPVSKNTMSRDNIPYGNRPANKPSSGKPVSGITKDFIERGLSAASLGLPFPYNYGASILGSGIDFYDAYNAKDPQVRNALLAEGALGLIPYGKAAKGIKLSKTKPIDFSLANKILDLKDLIYPDNNIYSSTVKPAPVSQQLNPKVVKPNSKPATNYSKKTYDVYHSKDNKMVTVDGKKMTMDQFNNGFFKSHPGANYVNHVFEHGGIYFEEGGVNQFDFVRNQGQKPAIQDQNEDMIMGTDYITHPSLMYKPMAVPPAYVKGYTTKNPKDWTDDDRKQYTWDFYAGNNPYKKDYIGAGKSQFGDLRYNDPYTRKAQDNYREEVYNSPEILKAQEEVIKKYGYKSIDDYYNQYDYNNPNKKIDDEINLARKPFEDKYFPSVDGVSFDKLMLNREEEDRDYYNLDKQRDNAILTNDSKQAYFNYLDSPAYIETAKNMWGDDYQKHIDEQKIRIQNVPIIYGNDWDMEKDLHIMDGSNSSMASYDPVFKKIYVQQKEDRVPNNIKHELSHSGDSGYNQPSDLFTSDYFYYTPPKINPKYENATKQQFYEWSQMDPAYQKWRDKFPTPQDTATKKEKYFKEPTEIRARVNALRTNMSENGFNWNRATEQELMDYLNNIQDPSLKLQFEQLINSDKTGLDATTLLDLFQNYAANENKTDTRYAENGAMIEMGGGGYTVTRSSDRKGKTHKVTGPDGTVKYFGDSNLGQHPKDEKRKAAFYARHKSNLAGNPYFRAFARKTWEEGGEIGSDDGMVPITFGSNPVKKFSEIKSTVKPVSQFDISVPFEYEGFEPAPGEINSTDRGNMYQQDYINIVNHPSYIQRLQKEMYGDATLNDEQKTNLQNEYENRKKRVASAHVQVAKYPKSIYDTTIKPIPYTTFYDQGVSHNEGPGNVGMAESGEGAAFHEISHLVENLGSANIPELRNPWFSEEGFLKSLESNSKLPEIDPILNESLNKKKEEYRQKLREYLNTTDIEDWRKDAYLNMENPINVILTRFKTEIPIDQDTIDLQNKIAKEGEIASKAKDYFNLPTEAKARINDLRAKAYKYYNYDYNTEFDITKYPELMKDIQYLQLQQYLNMTPENINELAKSVAQNNKSKDGLIYAENGGKINNDREMLDGVADILRRVDDKKNRKRLADYMMGNFRDENVSFQPNEFLEDSNVYANGGMIDEYAMGGTLPPIYTNNPRDPRLQSYNDSAQLYNNYLTNLNTTRKAYGEYNHRYDPYTTSDIDQQSQIWKDVIKEGLMKKGMHKDKGFVDPYVTSDLNNVVRRGVLPAMTYLSHSEIMPIGIDSYVNGRRSTGGGAVYDVRPGETLHAVERYKKPVQPIIYRGVKKPKPKVEENPGPKVVREIPAPLNPNYKPKENFMMKSYSDMINGTLPEEPVVELDPVQITPGAKSTKPYTFYMGDKVYRTMDSSKAKQFSDYLGVQTDENGNAYTYDKNTGSNRTWVTGADYKLYPSQKDYNSGEYKNAIDPTKTFGMTTLANGGMIKRADGSYSQRGLWDNIRANKGSGKKPTKEMLRQEKKIKSQYSDGGMIEMEDGGLFFKF